jgi:pilus assembly protein CpaB
MSIRNFLILSLSATIAAAIGFFPASARQVSARQVTQPHLAIQLETTPLLIAKTALARGDMLLPKHLQWAEWPHATVPPDSFTSVEDLFGTKGDQRRYVLRTIYPGTPIRALNISGPGDEPPASFNLGPGLEMVSIRVDASSGVIRFITAGDRVDVFMTRTLNGQEVTSEILQDIRVLGITPQAGPETPAPPSGYDVLVEARKVQAQKLELVQQVGRLSLTLRGIGAPGDSTPPLTPKPDNEPVQSLLIKPVFRIPIDNDPIRPDVPPDVEP